MAATPEENVNPPTDTSSADTRSTDTSIDVAELLQSLRRKEGNWIAWGQSCQQLQKAGYSPQKIFEETGFEPIQQNQIVVASQVYASMLTVGISEPVRSRFEQTGSDTLYEFRILTQPERAAAAQLVVDKGIDSEGAREIAKAIKDFSRFSTLPQGFTTDSGDAVAYYYWKLARQNSDLQDRSRLIAQALRFAHSATARQQAESLLTDFTVKHSRPAPLLPVYRLDSEEQMPRVIPVVGKLPLTTADVEAVPLVEAEGVFGLVKFSATGAWVAVPGWQVILNAEDPIALLSDSDQLPSPLPGKTEEVLVIIDRAQRQWDADSYFILDQEGQLLLQWSEDTPNLPILGRVILVMRPKKILDEHFTKDPWQIDE